MDDNTMFILNVISIMFLLAFVSYLSYIVEGMNKAVWRWMHKDRDAWDYIITHKLYLWCYALIPITLSIAVVQISQLNVGIPYIKTGWIFVASSLLWICLFFFVRALHQKVKNNE